MLQNEEWPPKSLAPVQIGGDIAKWEEFNWDRHPKLRASKKIIVDWYNDLPNSGALVLAGEVGCGKTHIAMAIANLYGRWQTSFYEEVELMKRLQATYSEKDGSERNVFRAIFKANLFILDDLGTYGTSNVNWVSNIYNQIFNDYLTVKGKPLLITTNLSMLGERGMADRIGARSFSRLCDGLGKISGGQRYIDLFEIPDFRVERYLDA